MASTTCPLTVAPPRSRRLLDLSPAPAHLEHYARSLGFAETEALPTLARTLSGQLKEAAGSEPALLIVKPPHLFLFHACPDDDPWLRVQSRALDQSCRDLLYIDAPQVGELCEQLAARLQENLGPEMAEACFTAIPRGGFLVLERLAAILDLPPERLQPADDPERILVVVDDCAISGARFRQFLAERENRRVVFAHLCSHPALRAAIQIREPRVLACLSAQDLHDLVPFEALPPEYQKRRLKRIENGECYWIGSTEALCFPWNEPDRSVWNPAAGRQERAWKIVPPELCNKNQPPPGAQTLPVQIQPQAPGPLRPAEEMVFGELEDGIVLCDLRTGQCFGLDGVGADIWRAMIRYGDPERIVNALEEDYEVAREALAEDIRAFLEDLQNRGLLQH